MGFQALEDSLKHKNLTIAARENTLHDIPPAPSPVIPHHHHQKKTKNTLTTKIFVEIFTASTVTSLFDTSDASYVPQMFGLYVLFTCQVSMRRAHN